MMRLNVLNRECELRDGHKSVLVSGNQKFLEYALRRVRLALWDSPSVWHEGLRVYDCIRWDYEFVSDAPVYPVKKILSFSEKEISTGAKHLLLTSDTDLLGLAKDMPDVFIVRHPTAAIL